MMTQALGMCMQIPFAYENARFRACKIVAANLEMAFKDLAFNDCQFHTSGRQLGSENYIH